MGIFGFVKNYRQGQQQRSFQKCGETLKNLVTTKDQRLEAIEFLIKQGSPAIPYLLQRYEIVIGDHGIQDTKEKEMIMEALLKEKEAAKPYLLECLKTKRRISWPIKILEKAVSRDEFIVALLENLTTEYVFFDENVQERNIEILLALKEVPDVRVMEKAKLLVNSRDEEVRVAALECLEAQAEHSDDARTMILSVLEEPMTDQTTRLHGYVKSMAQRHGWI